MPSSDEFPRLETKEITVLEAQIIGKFALSVFRGETDLELIHHVYKTCEEILNRNKYIFEK